MQICKLCLQAEADKKNSHILPHFLIKTAINENGSLARDKELTFSLSPRSFVTVFYGRNISPEKIAEIQGRELTDAEIADLDNPFTRNNIFCTICEKKLSVIESYFSDETLQNLNNLNLSTSLDQKGNVILNLENSNLCLFYLFIYSIFWRCSIENFDGFKLQRQIENNLRSILANYLSLDIQDTLISFNSKPFKHYPIVVTYTKIEKDVDPTANFITSNSGRFPYFIIANNFTFQLFDKLKQVKSSVQHLNGLSQMISSIDAVMTGEESVRVIKLDDEKYNRLKGYTFEKIADSSVKYFNQTFNQLHLAIFGVNPPPVLVELFFKIFLETDIPLGERYTPNNFIRSAYRAYSQLGY